MISLLVTIIDMAYTSKIKLSHYATAILITTLFLSIIGITLLVIKDWCNAYIALVDFSAALTILILLLKKLNKFKV